MISFEYTCVLLETYCVGLCQQKYKTNIKQYTMCPADNATAGSWAGVGLVN
jgi:hypothetical protein